MHISKKCSALQREIYRFSLFGFCLSLVFSLSACDDDEEKGCSFEAEIYVLDSYQRNEESCTPGGEELLGTDQAQVSHALLTCGSIYGFILYQARSCSSLEACERAREAHLNGEFPDFDDVEGEFSVASTSSNSSSSDNCATVDYSQDSVTRSGDQLHSGHQRVDLHRCSDKDRRWL